MASLNSVLKDEITRLSRKEIRKQVDPVRKAVSGHRHEIAALKRTVGELQRALKSLSRPRAVAEASSEDVASFRFSASALHAMRARLGLSAKHFGMLAGGVSEQTIYNWEGKKTTPRTAQLRGVAALRSIGKREAQTKLQQLLAQAPSKRKGAKKR